MWTHLRPLLVNCGLDPIRVENFALAGTPDVNITNAWIELKRASAWPKRDRTPLRLPHFTPQQRVWLLRRWRAGGAAFLMLRVGTNGQAWMLFAGDVAALRVGHADRAELHEIALAVWPSGVDSTVAQLLHRQTVVDALA